MRIAYLTTKYPSVSHTFIRRELRDMERRGHTLLRLAIRPPDAAPVDPADREEFKRTLHCLAQPRLALAGAVLRTLFGHPSAFLYALCLALRMGWRSDRGLLRHLAYFVEACFLLGVLRRQGVEHMHVHFGTNPTAVARLIRRLGGPSYSFTVHGPDEFDAPRQLDLAGKVADAVFVLAISDYGAAQLRRWIPLEHWPKIHVVHCTVGEDFLQAARPVDPASHTFVCVGRLCPQKGQLLLLEALRRLQDDGLDARLVLAGDGELRPQLEARIRALGLHDHVEITGWIDEAEVRRRILAARALVLPSFAEGLPMVLMEALALGRPVISTYVAGIPELVRPGENGWLVPAGNAAALTRAIEDVLTTAAHVLDAMGQAGRNRAREMHSTVAEGARLERLFVAVQEVDAHEGPGSIFGRGPLGATASAAAGV